MNRNYLYAAIPFAAIFDIGLVVKAFNGYSDPTMLVLMGISLVAFVVLVLKAFDKLRLPSLKWGQPAEVHNHYHTHYDRDEDEDEDYHNDCDDCGYTDEDLAEAREEGRKDGFDSGYEQGHESGYDAGYDARKGEETEEARELAKVIIDALRLDGVIKHTPAEAPQPVAPITQTFTGPDTPPSPTAGDTPDNGQ